MYVFNSIYVRVTNFALSIIASFESLLMCYNNIPMCIQLNLENLTSWNQVKVKYVCDSLNSENYFKNTIW